MNLNNARILIAAQYAAPYEGNFIASLENLQNRLKKEYNVVCAFVFPRKMAEQPWAKAFMERNEVSLTGTDKALISKIEAMEILQKFKPNLIYTHFEGYDKPFSIAAGKVNKSIRQVWHMHDTLKFQRNVIKAVYQISCFFSHYGLPIIKNWNNSIKPCLISVCQHESTFVKLFRLGIPVTEITIPNGINMHRIARTNNERHDPFSFLAFVGRNVQKRADLLLLAADKLNKSGVKLNVILVDGQVDSIASQIFDNKPDWLTEVRPQENINEIFAMADCFVSTSVHETFSYAIAEASVYGLPVIQSDIEGTKWNKDNPSAFLFPSGNVEALADTMLKVMNVSADDMMKRCAETRIRNIHECSMDAWSGKIIEFFKVIP